MTNEVAKYLVLELGIDRFLMLLVVLAVCGFMGFMWLLVGVHYLWKRITRAK